jgi:PAS fold
MKGWSWRVAIHPEHADQVLAKIKLSFMSGKPWEDTFPIRSKEGDYRWFPVASVADSRR